MRSSRLSLAALLAATAFLSGCMQDTMLHRYQHVADRMWSRADTLCFPIPEAENTALYDLSIGLRVGNRFPYQKLYLLVEQRLESPAVVRRDTLCYDLIDQEGHSSENGITLLQYESEPLPFRLQEGQRGEVRVSHLMHRDPMPEISDVGIHISRQGTHPATLSSLFQ